MKGSWLLGLGAFALGEVLLIFAWSASGARIDQAAKALSGGYASEAVWFLVIGVVSVVIGGGLLLFGGRRS